MIGLPHSTDPSPFLIMPSVSLIATSINLNVISLTQPGFESMRLKADDLPKWKMDGFKVLMKQFLLRCKQGCHSPLLCIRVNLSSNLSDAQVVHVERRIRSGDMRDEMTNKEANGRGR